MSARSTILVAIALVLIPSGAYFLGYTSGNGAVMDQCLDTIRNQQAAMDNQSAALDASMSALEEQGIALDEAMVALERLHEAARAQR